MKSFQFPALVTFLYRGGCVVLESFLDVHRDLVRQAMVRRRIENKHPNDSFQENEYTGHCIYEMNNFSKEYLESQKKQFHISS